MFDRTRRRGPGDTPAPAAGAASPVLAVARRLQPSRRVVVVAWLIAVLVHVPALPFHLGGWLDLLLDRAPAVDDEPIEGESFIPIELDLGGLEAPGDPGGAGEGSATPPSGATEGDVIGTAPSASVSPPPPPPSSAPPPPPPPPPSASPPGDAGALDDPYADAGAPDAGPSAELPDAGAPDAELPDADTPDTDTPDTGLPDAGAPDGGVDAGPPPVASLAPDAGAPPGRALGDPDELTKVTKGLTPAPNVQVLLVGKKLRAHPVGKELGGLLASLPEWSSFFAGTGIDPVTHLEHMQITGPQLRKSAQVVSILEFSSSADDIRKAVDVLVKRSKGEWLTGKAFPTARARAHGAERLFVILPSRRILAVLPGDDEKKIDALARLPTYPPDLPFAIQISLATPHRAFRSIDAIQIPESIKTLRLRAYDDGTGGGRLELELLDASPADASKNAAVMTEQWGKVQAAAMLGMLFLGDMPFRAEGATIVGATTFTPEQLERILALATKNFAGKSTRSPSKGR